MGTKKESLLCFSKKLPLLLAVIVMNFRKRKLDWLGLIQCEAPSAEKPAKKPYPDLQTEMIAQGQESFHGMYFFSMQVDFLVWLVATAHKQFCQPTGQQGMAAGSPETSNKLQSHSVSELCPKLQWSQCDLL